VDQGTIVNTAAAVGQVAAAILALVALILSVRTAGAQQRLAKELAREQSQLLFEQVRMQRDSDILAWTHECVDVLAECEGLVESAATAAPGPEAREQLRALRQRLSALIDYGRMFFPNHAPDKKGAENPAAYQGFRQRILSRLVAAYNVVAKLEALKSDQHRLDRLARLVELRRKFVSEAQLALDPRRFIALKEMNEIRLKQGIAIQSREERDPAEVSDPPGLTP
jgi:hypothetical protein